MAKKDEVGVNLEFEGLKEMECAWCRTTFRYRHQETVSGSGANELQAKHAARQKAHAAVAQETGSEKCPTCGAVQVCMQASSQAAGHGCAMWVGGILLFIAVGLSVLLSDNTLSFISMPVLSWLVGVCVLLLLVLNVVVARSNPNADLQKGLEEAKKKLDEKQLWIVSSGSTADVPDSIPRSLSLMQCVGLGLMVLGVLSVPGAELFRLVSGWPANKSASPIVAGPGDAVTLYFPESLSCLKGKWRGTVQVEFTDADGKWPKRPLEATCPTEDWGGWVGGKRVTNRNTSIWTKIQIPDDAELSGKTLRLHSKIAVTYPHSTGVFGFENREANFAHDFELRLVTARAGEQYQSLWWIGLLGGGGLVVFSSYLLRQIQRGVVTNSPQPKTLSVKEVTETPDDDDEVAVLDADE